MLDLIQMVFIRRYGIWILLVLLVGYVSYTAGYNSLLRENKELVSELSEKRTKLKTLDEEYTSLLSDHNKLVKKWNQQQEDIKNGKYTQYVQGPTQYVPTYSSPTYCSTHYYSLLDSASTTCY